MAKPAKKTPKKRIKTIDVLRGFALAGILYAHMVIWYTGAALPADIYFKYNNTVDTLALAIFGAFVFGKFFSVFSFLFGLSFFLQFQKNQDQSGYPGMYIWRLFLLFLIGIVHHSLWRGDILAIYAVLGLFLLFFRHFPIKLIMILSLLLITNLPNHLFELLSETSNTEISYPMEEKAEEYYDLVQNDSFLTVLKENWKSWPSKINFQLESGRLLMTFGYFLLGLFAGRTNLFTSIETQLAKFRRWNQITEKAVLILLLLGLIMYLTDLVSLPRIEVAPEFRWFASFLFSIYNVCLSIFYITGITLLFRNNFFQRLLEPLSVMGRMALTNYLLQTFFGLLLFYDFGIDLFDKTSPAINVLLAILVFYLQLKFSRIWLRHYKQGPVEWLWRCLTYFRMYPNRKGSARSLTSGPFL